MCLNLIFSYILSLFDFFLNIHNIVDINLIYFIYNFFFIRLNSSKGTLIEAGPRRAASRTYMTLVASTNAPSVCRKLCRVATPKGDCSRTRAMFFNDAKFLAAEVVQFQELL